MQFEKAVGGALAVAVIAGMALWSAPSFTQTNPDPNAAPNPYRLGPAIRELGILQRSSLCALG